MARIPWCEDTRATVLHVPCTALWKAAVETSPHPNTLFLSPLKQSTTAEGRNTQLSREQDRPGATQFHIKGHSGQATLSERMELKCSRPAASSTAKQASGAGEKQKAKT